MKIRVFFTTSLFIFAAQAFPECGEGLVPVREGALLQHLQEGAFFSFVRRVDVPTFVESTSLTPSISLYMPPKAFPRYFAKGREYKIQKSRDYMLGADQFEVYFNPNEVVTVGDLRKLLGETLDFCAKVSASIPIR